MYKYNWLTYFSQEFFKTDFCTNISYYEYYYYYKYAGFYTIFLYTILHKCLDKFVIN